MQDKQAKNESGAYTPAGWPRLIPRLSVEDPAALVQFLRTVFGARGDYHADRPTELWLGDSLIMVGAQLERASTQTFLYLYVASTDAVFDAALDAGAKAIESPAEMPYGDRRAMIEDPWGNRWQIATHREFHT